MPSVVGLRRLVSSRTSVNQLLILRLLVHPMIWSTLILLFSNTVRHIGEHWEIRSGIFACIRSLPGLDHTGAGAVPNLMQAVLWIWPVMYKSIYGRFLLLQLGTAGNIVLLNVLISVFNIGSRLATRQVGC
jgi:hypothetical protein